MTEPKMPIDFDRRCYLIDKHVYGYGLTDEEAVELTVMNTSLDEWLAEHYLNAKIKAVDKLNRILDHAEKFEDTLKGLCTVCFGRGYGVYKLSDGLEDFENYEPEICGTCKGTGLIT